MGHSIVGQEDEPRTTFHRSKKGKTRQLGNPGIEKSSVGAVRQRPTRDEWVRARVDGLKRSHDAPVTNRGAHPADAQRPIDRLNTFARPEPKGSDHGGWSVSHQTEQSCLPIYRVPVSP